MKLFVVFIILFTIYLVFKPSLIENLPDETQFFLCEDIQTPGFTNYKTRSNILQPPQQGFITSLIENTGESHDYSHYYTPPHCGSKYMFRNDYFPEDTVVDSEDTFQHLINPMDKHPAPDYDKTILYEDTDIINTFTQHHDEVNKEEIMNRSNLSE